MNAEDEFLAIRIDKPASWRQYREDGLLSNAVQRDLKSGQGRPKSSWACDRKSEVVTAEMLAVLGTDHVEHLFHAVDFLVRRHLGRRDTASVAMVCLSRQSVPFRVTNSPSGHVVRDLDDAHRSLETEPYYLGDVCALPRIPSDGIQVMLVSRRQVVPVLQGLLDAGRIRDEFTVAARELLQLSGA